MNIYIVGDSFSTISPDSNSNIWINQLPARLHDFNISIDRIINFSMAGVSQDYIFNVIESKIIEKIKEDDVLIVVITHPSRFWFFEDHPEYSNVISVGGIGLENTHRIFDSKRFRKAVELFYTDLYRDNLAENHQKYRLGWLSYIVKILNLKKPIVLQGFHQNQLDYEDWPDLLVSRGNLTDVQSKESTEIDRWNDWWDMYDLRFNHLCIRNHQVLVNKIVESIISQRSIDLSEGFHRGFINENSHHDPEFVKNELDPIRYNNWKKR